MNSFILPIIKSHVIFNENTNNLKILNNPKYQGLVVEMVNKKGFPICSIPFWLNKKEGIL